MICPKGCLCQAVRAPGVKCTLRTRALAGSGGEAIGSNQTSPVNDSSGPGALSGCSRVIFILLLSLAPRLNSVGRGEPARGTRSPLSEDSLAEQWRRPVGLPVQLSKPIENPDRAGVSQPLAPLEGTDPPVEAEPHSGVDVLRRGDPFAEGEVRLVHDLGAEPIEDRRRFGPRHLLLVGGVEDRALGLHLGVGAPVGRLGVVVEAVAALSPEPAGGDHASLNRMRAPARLAEGLLVERASDV